MFSNCIENTSFTDSISREYFKSRIHVGNTSFRGRRDKTLESTCRALLFDRIPEGEKLSVEYWDFRNNLYRTERDATGLLEMMERYCEEDKSNGYTSTLKIISVSTDEDFGNIYASYQKSESWQEVEKVKLFFMKMFNCCAFSITEEKQSVIIFECKRGRDVVIKFFHALQAVLVNVLPWYFKEGRSEITDLEYKLIKSIAGGNENEYLEALEEISRAMGYKEEAVKRLLEGFETQIDVQTKGILERNITNYDTEINNYIRNIENAVARKKECQQKLTGILVGLNNKTGHKLRDMFDTYDCLRFKEIDGDSMYFAVDTYLNWDDGAKQNVLHEKTSSLYSELPDDKRNNLEKVLTEVFDTKRIKVRVSGEFVLSTSAMLRGRSEIRPEVSGYMPNPHIYRYACTEGFNGDIAEALAKADFAAAVEIAIVSAGNINFDDPTVMGWWGRWIGLNMCDGIACFELPDGTNVTYQEAIKWIDEQKGEEHE